MHSAQPGQRTAVNLAGMDTSEIERGMVLAEVGRLVTTQIIDVELSVLRSAPAGNQNARARACASGYSGSACSRQGAEFSGEIAPGDSGFAQLRLESPVVALHGERFIVRSYSPAQTIAGGLVLDPAATKHRGKELTKTEERLAGVNGSEPIGKARGLCASIRRSRIEIGATLVRERDGPTKSYREVARQAQHDGAVLDIEGVLITRESMDRLAQAALEEVKLHHQRQPLSRGLPRETLRERHFAHAPAEIFRGVLARLEKEGLLVSEKDVVRAADHSLGSFGC